MPLPNDFLGLQFTSCHYCKFQTMCVYKRKSAQMPLLFT